MNPSRTSIFRQAAGFIAECSFVFGLMALLFVIALLAGCSVLTKPVVTKQAVIVTNYVAVPTLRTLPGTPSVIPAAALEVQPAGPTLPLPVVNPQVVTNYVYQTNFVPNPAFLSGVAVARQVNELNPTPTAAPVNLLLGGLTALASLAAAYQNRKAKAAVEASEISTDVAHTVVLAVENLPPEIGNTVKSAVKSMSAFRNIASEVNAVVQAAVTPLKA